MVIRGGDRPQLEHELVEVQVLAELAFLNRDLRGAPQHVCVVALGFRRSSPGRAWLVVQLGRNSVENTASSQALFPLLQGAFENRAKAGLASRLCSAGAMTISMKR